MKFAVNFSKEAEQLVKDDSVAIDIFKCPDFSKELIERAEATKPCYIHFALNAGNKKMAEVDWELIQDLRERTETPFVNIHAVAFAKDYPNMDVLTRNPADRKQMVKAAIEDIEVASEKVGAEKIIVENVICRGEGENMMQPIIDPDILSEIVTQTGCGFLLDTAHARMTSMSLGYDVYDYITKLPLEHLKELHVTGIQPDEKGRLRDSMPMTREDWEIAAWVMNKIKDGDIPEPWVVALEYGGVGPAFEWRSEKEILAKQLPTLYDLVKSVPS